MALLARLAIPKNAVGQRSGERRVPGGRLLFLSNVASLKRFLVLALLADSEARCASYPATNSVVVRPTDLASSMTTRRVGLAKSRSNKLTYVRSMEASKASSVCDLLAAILTCLRCSPNTISTGCRSGTFLRQRVEVVFWVVATDAKMRQCGLNYDGVNAALMCENIACRLNAAKNFADQRPANRDASKIKNANIANMVSPSIKGHLVNKRENQIDKFCTLQGLRHPNSRNRSNLPKMWRTTEHRKRSYRLRATG